LSAPAPPSEGPLGVLAAVLLAVLSACTQHPPAAVPATDPLVVTGARLFQERGCSVCHSTDGSGRAGPTVRHLAGATVRLANGGQAVADDDYLLRAILEPDAEVARGYPGHTMDAVAPAITPADARAIVAYIKNLR